MYYLLNDKSSKHIVLQYTYPILHTGASWYVDFYAFDPAMGKMRRKKCLINQIKGAKLRREYALDLMTSLLNKLRSGWNPWVDDETKRTYALFEDVSAKYEKTLEKTLRKNTRDSYLSRINVLRAYLKQQPTPIKYAYQFNSALVVDFFCFP